ncbi:MAG: FecR domain-containing protein [Thermodesulfobacteriota bacterium]|nr:FecR domain-containing protein [Thermodesulfobacteriota bacterium]
MLKTERIKHLFLLYLLVTALLLTLLSLPVNAEEKDATGRIVAIRGQATAHDVSGTSRSLQLKGKIRVGELIKTGNSCRLQIMFSDNTIVSLGPDSEFLVKDYTWDAESGQGKMTSQVNEGVFRVLGGSITKSAPQNFLTETPSATIGIRGSMYAGWLRNGELRVVFQGGKGIFVRNAQGRVEIDTPGFGTRLAGPKQAPVKPYKILPAELGLFNPLTVPPEEIDSSLNQATALLAGKEGDHERTIVDSKASWNEEAAQESVPKEKPKKIIDPPSPQEIPDIVADETPEPLPQTETTDQAQDQIDLVYTQPSTLSPDAVVSGYFMAALQDDDELVNITDLTWTGSVSGQVASGVLSIQAATNNGTLIVDVPVEPYDPSLSYSGQVKRLGQERNVNLLGMPTLFSSADVASDNTGEFAVFVLDDLFYNGLYSYRELGFAGTPTLSLPTTGIDRFNGPLLVTLDDILTEKLESFCYNHQTLVNWHNGKVIGAILTLGPFLSDPDKASGFFFGNLSGIDLSNVQFVGMDVVGPDPGLSISMPLTINGTISFSQFYGNQAQGLGFVASGNTYDVATQVAEEAWQLIAGGYRDPTTLPSTTGSVNWEGFVIGIGEDMKQIDVNRRLFMNSLSSEFSLAIDRDNGTINGSLNAIDQADPNATINALNIGGANESAYISDQIIIAILGGTTPIFISPINGPLKTYGNYLITGDPNALQLASYATWGIWEIAYSEPGSGKDYHIHNPGSLWIAGEPTSLSELATLTFTGTYTGLAEGNFIPSTGQYYRMPTGTTTFDVDFGTSMLTSGSIVFPAGTATPAINLGVDPSSLGSTGFNTTISSPNFGTVNGAFFGPSAASVAGNFDAQVGTDRVIGIFGGDR